MSNFISALFDAKSGQTYWSPDLAVSATDRGFTLGDGVFGTMLIRDGQVADRDRHLARLARHAAILSLEFPFSALGNLIDEIILKNEAHQGFHVLRVTITRGTGPRGLRPPAEAKPLALLQIAPGSDPATFKPARLHIAQTVRRNEFSPLSRVKSLNYGDNLLAMMEAAEAGMDDALMLNTAGRLACTSIANIFIRKSGTLYTPPLSEGAMDGTVRQTLLDRSQASERALTVDDLAGADAVFLTNSLMRVRPVCQAGAFVYETGPSYVLP